MSGAIAELWSDFYCQITTQNSRFSQFKKVFWWDYFSVFRSLGCCFEFGQSILSTIAQIWHENSAHNFFRQIAKCNYRSMSFNKFFLLLFRSLGCYFEFGRPVLSNLRGQFRSDLEDRFQRKSVRGVYPKSSRSDRRFHSGMFDIFLNT